MTAGVALALVAGCADDHSTELGVGQDPTVETAPPTSVDGAPSSGDEIVAMVDRAAEGLGEPEPTDVEWVRSTRKAANVLISDSVVGAGEPDVDVLVVQARGDFTVEGTAGPPDEETGRTAPAPTGSTLTIVVDATSGALLDFGVHPAPADLAELGEVHAI